MSIDWEPIARSAVSVASGIVSGLSPVAGVVLEWAGETAFAIYDAEKAAGKPDPVAAAELAGDRVADLIERLKLGSS